MYRYLPYFSYSPSFDPLITAAASSLFIKGIRLIIITRARARRLLPPRRRAYTAPIPPPPPPPETIPLTGPRTCAFCVCRRADRVCYNVVYAATLVYTLGILYYILLLRTPVVNLAPKAAPHDKSPKVIPLR